MTIYSVIPMELIFAGMESQTFDYSEITYKGVTMQVERVGMHQAEIVRLLSNHPNDYLNPEYTPGTMISFHPSTDA